MVGCDGPPKFAPAIPVKGEVFFKKTTPADGAFIVFQPKSPELMKSMGGRAPSAHVREDGSYELTTYMDKDGAPEGEYNVTIVWEKAPKEAKMVINDRGAGPDRLQGKYGNPSAPKLSAKVEAGKSNSFRFEVE